MLPTWRYVTSQPSEGNGWNIPKLHALLHLVEMVTKHGVMANSNGGPCESHFRLNLKKPAKTTQRRNATFACDTLRSYGRQIHILFAASFGEAHHTELNMLKL